METPTAPIKFVPVKAGETLSLGTVTIRILEDGSKTDNRIGSAEFIVPPHTNGPPAHWHEMHDETFLVLQGTLRFHGLRGETVDAKQGDYIVVPPRCAHTFSNPFDEEAKFFNTYTPAFYINYFKLLATMAEQGKPMDPESNRRAMAYFATIGVSEQEMGAGRQN
ncbi:cupin domain-containing protein [Hirsutella rhossiliensis]|uniref:Cupin domain-containing protein n=1 Tax=Hirsutella rhossiliensis TaxID=111463 RepID=A0A9P8MZL3_9HYPO|nr:cupin domain-containing protein [Hirsutella rhossiliensis]KAH0964195.1 cupin domain-containing protein [Hirsutella rhossiliensis]